MKLLKLVRMAYTALFKPFAGPGSIKNGMGPASEGNPTGYFH